MKELQEEFSFKTLESSKFDQHISDSIIGYDALMEDIKEISRHFIIGGQDIVYDIGCSTGKLIKEMGDMFPDTNFIGIENEPNFFKHHEPTGNVRFLNNDIYTVPLDRSSMIMSIFTLQFIEPDRRSIIIKKIYDSLKFGGGFIWAEKTYEKTGQLQDVISFLYYDQKRKVFTDKEILDKQYSLRNKMKLLTMADNIKMLDEAGFQKTSIFWKRYSFMGLIAIK